MKLVAAITFSSFLLVAHSKEVNTNLLSQLLGKSYSGFDNSVRAEDSVVYILGHRTIMGLGVCLRSATIIVHRWMIEDEKRVEIYIREKRQRAIARVVGGQMAFALMLIINEPSSINLRTVTYVPFFEGQFPRGLLGRAVGVEAYNTANDLSLVRIEKKECVLEGHHAGLIQVGAEASRQYENIGDPLFYCNQLLGFLVIKRDAMNKSFYYDVRDLLALQTTMSGLAHPAIEGDPNFTVNNPF